MTPNLRLYNPDRPRTYPALARLVREARRPREATPVKALFALRRLAILAAAADAERRAER